ncbi:transmembrane protease serine 12 [Brachionus plicatilis]|uniref:Transmembrane protease serine 12 n=1 Tax=Brachionus plicatilis TaxID=10195 RepID=A0A3M7SHV7_BRAPC|nr:transmembrane protease serine 12 [Brachionus plicatilis]
MSNLIETNNTVYPVIPDTVNPPTEVYQSKNVAKKSSKKKKLAIGCLIAVVVIIIIIIIVVAVVLAVLLTKKCRYGEKDGKCIECGVTFSSNKIVGGQNAGYKDWPSIVYLQSRYTQGGSIYTSFCGGTLVNLDTVITAAHCYDSKYTVTVYLGLHDKSDLSSGVARSVKSYTIHPNYDSTTELNDIAIIKLSTKVDLNDRIQVSCLPEDESIYPKNNDISAYIAGWGRTIEGAASSPNILQEALITVYDSSKCSSVSPGTSKDWNKQICAGKYSGGVDSCQGDSGGPLYVQDKVEDKNKFILSGVTSYGVGCARVGMPGIYTRVSAYIDWIEEKMNEK